MPVSKFQALVDSLAWAVPFSIIGAVFGDAIRKDALTPRQALKSAAGPGNACLPLKSRRLSSSVA